MGRIPNAMKEKALNSLKNAKYSSSTSSSSTSSSTSSSATTSETNLSSTSSSISSFSSSSSSSSSNVASTMLNHFTSRQQFNRLDVSCIGKSCCCYTTDESSYTHGASCSDRSHSPSSSESIESNGNKRKLDDSTSDSASNHFYNKLKYKKQNESTTTMTLNGGGNLFLSLLNERIYQAFGQIFAEKKSDEVEDADEEATSKEPAALDQIWSGLVQSIHEFIEKMMRFVKDLPGFNNGSIVGQEDLNRLVNQKLFDLFIVVNASQFANGECLIRLNNGLQYKREHMNLITGKPKVDHIFRFVDALDELNLNAKEKCLLVPLMLTMPLPNQQESNQNNGLPLKELNDFYTKVILNEFSSNKRDFSFLFDLNKVLAILNDCK